MDYQQYLRKWSASYKVDLTDDIMAFWLKHGLDKKHGGIYTCLNRDGSLMDTTKSVWFQGRFGFIAAYAYNCIEKRQEWLDASKSCIDFIIQHCTDAHGRMYFEVTEDGTPLRMRRYLLCGTSTRTLSFDLALQEHSRAFGTQISAVIAMPRALFNNDINQYGIAYSGGNRYA